MSAVRTFFAARRVLEVTTPILAAVPVSDPHVASMTSEENFPSGLRRLFLRTSPEYCHKRLLAAGLGDIYELGPVFRAGDQGRWHESEFMLLEWYRRGWTWRDLAGEAVELIRCVAATLSVPPVSSPGSAESASPSTAAGHWKSAAVCEIPYRELLAQHLACDVMVAGNDLLARLAHEHGLNDTAADRAVALDYLYGVAARQTLAVDQITIVHDFPPEQAALARLIETADGPLAERFEIYLGRLEIVNGYRELTSAVEQRRRFAGDQERRRQLALPAVPTDEALLAALDHGLPECAGAALGFDRLVAVLTGAQSLAEVLAFPAG